IPTRQAAPAYAGLGEAFFQLGRLDLSLQAYAMVLNLDPGNPVGAQGRSRALLAMGKPAEALPDANAAVLANPNALGSWRNRGSDLAAMGRNEEALADFNQALLRDPSNALTWKSRGGLLVRMGRFDEALRDLNEAIRLDPNLASAYQNRGAAYNCLRQYDKAAKDLETAVKLDPDNVGAHNNLGLSLSALGSPDQAVIEFSEAIRLGAANASVFLNRALAYERLGVVDASARDFTEAMRHDPQSTLAKEGLERLHKAELAQNSPPSDSPMAMPLPGPTFEGVMHLAQALLASGDPQGAIRSLSEAIRIDPHRAEPYEMRAQARLMVGEDGAGQDARTFLKQSRWASPSSAEVAILGILADRREGRLNDAQVLLDEALANTAPDRWPHPALMYLRGQIDPAGLLEKAISQTQKAEAQALIGLSLGMAGDRQGAIEPLRQAIALGPNDSSSKIVEVARAALAQIE
ncbi:MAG TPA: tetratricopeptide repeat protein, partial [Isosphaeraceae bacterium]|nr:tetratricopeptide repeat protein [Isosphaeraceae bacterium]